MFHIDLLPPYKETEEYRQTYMRPPLITVQSKEEYEVESNLQARQKGGYPSVDDSGIADEDLQSPDLPKEFYDQEGKVLQDKKRCTKLRRAINSLSCLLPTMNTISSLRSSSMETYPLMRQCNKSRGLPFTQPTLYAQHPTTKAQWWQEWNKKEPAQEVQSLGAPLQHIKGTTKGETPPPISSTPHHSQSTNSYSSVNMPSNKISYQAWSSSMKTTLISWPYQPWYQTMSPSSSLTLTSFYPHMQAHHT